MMNIWALWWHWKRVIFWTMVRNSFSFNNLLKINYSYSAVHFENLVESKTRYSNVSSFPGEYWVVGVDIVQYDENDPTKYLRGLLQKKNEPIYRNAFRSYLGVAPRPPINITNFAVQVNKYMEESPFNFSNPIGHLGGVKVVCSLLQIICFIIII